MARTTYTISAEQARELRIIARDLAYSGSSGSGAAIDAVLDAAGAPPAATRIDVAFRKEPSC